MGEIKSLHAKYSIKKKFIGWFLLVSVLPLILVSFVIQNMNSKITVKKEEEAMHNLLLSKAEFVNQWFSAQMGEMQVAAESDVMKSMDSESMIPYLQTLEARSKVFETMFVLNTDGTVIAHSKPESIGSDYSDRSYYPIALKGESTYSEVLISKATGNRIIVGATPIKDDNGNIIGIMCGSANFEILVDTLLKNDEDVSSNLVLIDNLGYIQVANNEEIIGKHIDESNLEQGTVNILKESLNSSGISSLRINGEQYIFAHAPIESVGFGLILETPEKIVLNEAKTIQHTVYIIIGISAIFIILFSIMIVQTITKPILRVAAGMNEVAAGNLNIEKIQCKNKDEIGQLTEHFNDMVHNVKLLVAEIKKATEQVQASSEEFTASSEETLLATEQISASIQTISASTDEQTSFMERGNQLISNISNRVHAITENIQQTNNNVDDAVMAAMTGTEVIQETINQMKAIEGKTNTATKAINLLGKKSNEINEIVSVITDIADQTNLLALNAAIEAARAGQYGKGFAVVADEVRKLAEQSSDASRQISKLIQEIQSEISDSVLAMNEGNNAVQDGMKYVDKAGNEFSNITIAVKKVSTQMNKILDESSTIKEHVERIVHHINEVLNSSMQTSSSIQEIASASEQQHGTMQEIASAANELAKMAETLNETAQKFKF